MMRQALLVIAHTTLATSIIGLLWMQYDQRRHAVAETRSAATQERKDTERVQQEVRVQQDLLRGIKQGDPYVVEMLAREKLDYQRPGELTPPTLPTEPAKPANAPASP